MLGCLRRIVENFDLNRFPHEYPKSNLPNFTDEETTEGKNKFSKQNAFIKDHGHMKKYMDFHRNYWSIYDVGVYIIVGVFMLVFLREAFIYFGDEKNKSYMFVCLVLIGICAVLY